MTEQPMDPTRSEAADIMARLKARGLIKPDGLMRSLPGPSKPLVKRAKTGKEQLARDRERDRAASPAASILPKAAPFGEHGTVYPGGFDPAARGANAAEGSWRTRVGTGAYLGESEREMEAEG